MFAHAIRTIFVLAATSAGACQAVAEDYALIVGVNDCPTFRLPGGTRPLPLRGAELDADRVARMLIDRYSFSETHVHILKGSEARLADVKQTFKKLIRQAHPDDRFVFYYAGHGTQIEDVKPWDEQSDNLDEALCLFDATATGEGLLRDDQLGVLLDDLPAQHVTVLLDCCHSGTGLKDADDEYASRSLRSVPLSRISRRTDRPWIDLQSSVKSIDSRLTVYYACEPQQQAYERRVRVDGRFSRSGQFTHYLLEALNNQAADNNGDGRCSQQELHRYVTDRIDADFNRLRLKLIDQQRPVLQSDNPTAGLFE